MDQEHLFPFSVVRFHEVEDVNPAGAVVAVFVLSIPVVAVADRAGHLLVVQRLDVLPRRIVNPKFVRTRIAVVLHMDGDGTVRGFEDVL